MAGKTDMNNFLQSSVQNFLNFLLLASISIVLYRSKKKFCINLVKFSKSVWAKKICSFEDMIKKIKSIQVYMKFNEISEIYKRVAANSHFPVKSGCL